MRMIISKSKFYEITNSNSRKLSIIGKLNKDWVIPLDEGAIETYGDNLGGSFEGDGKFWGVYEMEDYTHNPSLPTNEILWAKQKASVIYDYGTYYKSSLKIFGNNDENKLREYFLCESPNGTLCSRHRLTYQELMMVKEDMDCWFEIRQNEAIDKARKYPWFNECPTVEHPYKLYIFGTDDTSYSKFFETKEEMYSFLTL